MLSLPADAVAALWFVVCSGKASYMGISSYGPAQWPGVSKTRA